MTTEYTNEQLLALAQVVYKKAHIKYDIEDSREDCVYVDDFEVFDARDDSFIRSLCHELKIGRYPAPTEAHTYIDYLERHDAIRCETLEEETDAILAVALEIVSE